MARKPDHPHRAILKKIGDQTLLDEGVPPYLVKSWKYRGVPWSARGKVARIAKAKRVPLPANFTEERVA